MLGRSVAVNVAVSTLVAVTVRVAVEVLVAVAGVVGEWVGGALTVAVGVGQAGQPFRALFTAATISLMVMLPS